MDPVWSLMVHYSPKTLGQKKDVGSEKKLWVLFRYMCHDFYLEYFLQFAPSKDLDGVCQKNNNILQSLPLHVYSIMFQSITLLQRIIFLWEQNILIYIGYSTKHRIQHYKNITWSSKSNSKILVERREIF